MPDLLDSQADIGLKHYKSGRDSWKVGYSHFLLRVRGFIAVSAFTLATMGSPWWWPSSWDFLNIPEEITISTSFVACMAVIGSLIVLFSLFLFARSRAQRSVECKDKWHSISHKMRDAFCGLLERTGARASKHDLGHEKRMLKNSANEISQSIVDYYKALTGAKCIGVAIRLAVDPPRDGVNQVFYTTVGRAGSISESRTNSSESIPASEGLPKLFRSAKAKASGVVYIHDLNLAIRYGLYKETANEKSFPNDYRYVIAVPLNGWNGRASSLIGLLTITGRSRRILAVQHVDLLKAIGDRLAEHYSTTVARLSASKRMPSFFPEIEQSTITT